MSSSSGAVITSPHEQQANAPAATTTTMDAKLMVATGNNGDVQQWLKDLVSKQEQDSKMTVVVMANQQQVADAAACAEKEKRLPHPHQRNMDPHLLALASSGSSEKLQALVNGERRRCQSSGHGGTDGSLTTRRTSACDDDTEANESILAGVTAEGDTALHVVAAYGQGDNFVIRLCCREEAEHLRVKKNRFHIAGGEHALTPYGYGDGDDFCESARIIYGKAKHLLFAQNNNGDTPLHCAARAGKSNMVKCLIHDLARGEGQARVKELLRKENKHKETALHQAVRVGNKDIVERLMEEDTELASFPQDGGVSPIYLAIVLEQRSIEATLYAKSHTKLSFSGPNGQNALHAAVLRYQRGHPHQGTGYTKLLELNKTHLCPQNKDLTTQRDENGSTPLHFAAGLTYQFGPSSVCRQVLEANPDALYQADHAGFFPIHVAASVGAFENVEMFVDKFPGSAGLRDAKGRTFLHVAVEKKNALVIKSACGGDLTKSWIMNMVDNDGNTALHLAVEAGSLLMFCPLLGNPQVNLNLPNKGGETPFDIAKYKIPEESLFDAQIATGNSEQVIFRMLKFAGAVKGVRRQDHFEDDKTLRVKHDKSKEMEMFKDSTGALCIGSVLIASVTFGATFAVPGGYIADDHNNGGSPILAPRYAFDAFIASNSLAFVFSTVATVALMRSGNSFLNLRRRTVHYFAASYFLSISITCLAAAFALGAYVVLAPVSNKTAVATCVLSCLVLLYRQMEFVGDILLLLPPLCKRKGFILAWVYTATMVGINVLFGYWPLIFIFGWAVHAKPAFIQR